MKQCTATAAKSLQSCPTLCDPRDSSPLGSPSLGSWWFSRGISVEEKSEGKRKLGGLVEPGMDGEVEGLISTALVAQPLRHVPVGEQRGAAQHHPGCFAHYKITYCVGTSEQPCSVTWGCIPGSPGESGLVSRGSQGLRSPLESRRGSLGAP